MVNSNKPFGLKPVKHFNGSTWNGKATLYRIPSTDSVAYYIGDVVKSAAGGDLVNGCSDVILYGTRNNESTSGAMRGVIVGMGSMAGNSGANAPIGADPSDLEARFIPATKTKDYYVYVCDDPTVIFEAQVDTIAATAFNKNCGLFVANAPTAPVHFSASYLVASTATTTNTLPIKIFGAPAKPDNDLTSPGTYGIVYCMLNTHELLGGTTAV